MAFAMNKYFLSLIEGWREKGYERYLDYFYEKCCGFSKIDEKDDKQIKANNQYDEVEEILKKTGFS